MTHPSASIQQIDHAKSIPVISGLTHDEFTNDYLCPHRPVVIQDALKDWESIEKWTPQFFKKNYPTKKLTIDGVEYTMEQFIDLVEQSNADQIAPYFRNEQLRNVFPELMPDLLPVPACTLPNWLRGPFYPSAGREAEIYIGGAGGGFPFLHYDSNSTHAFLAQVYGEKEVVLYSPSDTKYLYARTDKPKRRHHSWITDVENPDLERFPLLAKAVAWRGMITPGDLIFIPSRWWHTARMRTPSITISYNVANGSNWHNVSDEIRYKARSTFGPLELPFRVYMALLGWSQSLYDRIRS